MKRVCVILPALNEEKAIGEVIKEIPKGVLRSRGYETKVLVLDGGSTDGTETEAGKAQVDYFLTGPKGKGTQLQWGLERTREIWKDSDFTFMLNSDFTYSPLEIPSLLEALKPSPPSLVVGSRLLKGKPLSMPKVNYIGNKALTWVASRLFPPGTSDLCSGFIGFPSSFLKEASIKAKGFDLEANIFTEAHRLGYGIVCVPINYRQRLGTPPKLKVSHSLIILLWLLKARFLP